MAINELKILAIETSTSSCSVALRHQGEILNRQQIGSNVHSQIVLQQIGSLLNESNSTIDELNAVAVGNGPGSFTGLRIGVGVGQGIAYGAQCSMIAVSSLAALALNAKTDGRVIAATDARMGEIYSAIFAKTLTQLEEIQSPIVAPPEVMQALSSDVLVGNAWSEYWQDLPAQVQSHCDCPEASFPLAENVLILAEREFESGQLVDPTSFAPVYVRNKVAKKKSEQG